MALFDGMSLDPKFDPSNDLWPATRDELEARGLKIHGGYSSTDTREGATAVVIKATELATQRVVAVKVYKEPDQQVKHRNGDTISMTNFFENERRMLAGLQDCPEVPAYYYSVDSATALTGQEIQPFHVTEFVDGKRITQYVDESLESHGKPPAGTPAIEAGLPKPYGKRRINDITELVVKMLHAGESIHQFGYLHRDISDGNVLVDKQGRIRLIDVAEASPLGEEHTRLVTTPGQGTEGVASPALQKVRAIQTDDVNSLCTIAYRLFTGDWKQQGETPADWQRRMLHNGVPKQIAKIVAKGMRPRDTNKQIDPLVWNSCQEVITAIESFQHGVIRARKARRWAAASTLVTVLVVVAAVLTWWHTQSNAFLAEVNELQQLRTLFAETPQALRSHARLQPLLKKADELEDAAHASHAERNTTRALRQLDQAQAVLAEAIDLVQDIQGIEPLVEPLEKILHAKYWHRDCAHVRDTHSALLKECQAIKQELRTTNPRQLRDRLLQLQTDITGLLEDNQQALELTQELAEFDRDTVGIAAELLEHAQYQPIAQGMRLARANFNSGHWPEARTQIQAQTQALAAFLQANETEAQKAVRVANRADELNNQIAANKRLEQQIKSLQADIEKHKSEIARLDKKNTDILVTASADRNAKQQAEKQRDAVQTQLTAAQADLAEKQKQLTAKQQELAPVAEFFHRAHQRIAGSDQAGRADAGGFAGGTQDGQRKTRHGGKPVERTWRTGRLVEDGPGDEGKVDSKVVGNTGRR